MHLHRDPRSAPHARRGQRARLWRAAAFSQGLVLLLESTGSAQLAAPTAGRKVQRERSAADEIVRLRAGVSVASDVEPAWSTERRALQRRLEHVLKGASVSVVGEMGATFDVALKQLAANATLQSCALPSQRSELANALAEARALHWTQATAPSELAGQLASGPFVRLLAVLTAIGQNCGSALALQLRTEALLGGEAESATASYEDATTRQFRQCMEETSAWLDRGGCMPMDAAQAGDGTDGECSVCEFDDDVIVPEEGSSDQASSADGSGSSSEQGGSSGSAELPGPSSADEDGEQCSDCQFSEEEGTTIEVGTVTFSDEEGTLIEGKGSPSEGEGPSRPQSAGLMSPEAAQLLGYVVSALEGAAVGALLVGTPFGVMLGVSIFASVIMGLTWDYSVAPSLTGTRQPPGSPARGRQRARQLLLCSGGSMDARLPQGHPLMGAGFSSNGETIDAGGMLGACECLIRRDDPLVAQFCQDAVEQRRDCILRPFAPDDGVRPECMDLLAQDNEVEFPPTCPTQCPAPFTLTSMATCSCGRAATRATLLPSQCQQILQCQSGFVPSIETVSGQCACVLADVTTTDGPSPPRFESLAPGGGGRRDPLPAATGVSLWPGHTDAENGARAPGRLP